jgi:hypothetical protein
MMTVLPRGTNDYASVSTANSIRDSWTSSSQKDLRRLERAALIIRGYGHAATETLQAMPWKEFIATDGG